MKSAAAPARCDRLNQLPDAVLDQVAAYFRALGEPTRLQLLQWLGEGEHTVGELAALCGARGAVTAPGTAAPTRRSMCCAMVSAATSAAISSA